VAGQARFEFIAHLHARRAQVIGIWNQERKDGTGIEKEIGD
jgi:hypothetical protein